VAPGTLNRLIVCEHAPRIRLGQTGNDVEQSCFATSARADKAYDLALLDFERDLIKRVHVCPRRPIPLGDPLDHELCRRSRGKTVARRH
jgi:hypothetical protein